MMRNKLSGVLIGSGLLILAGLAGSEDLAVYTGQAGRPLWDLVIWALIGCGMLGTGVAGLNREGRCGR